MKVVLKWRSSNWKYKGIVEPVTLQSLISIYNIPDFTKLTKEEIEDRYMGVSGLLQLLNIAIPAVANLIVSIRHRDGSQSAIVYLDEADAQFAANQAQIQQWMAQRQQAQVQPQVTPSAIPATAVPKV